VLDDHFEESFYRYVKEFFKKHNVRYHLDKTVRTIIKEENKFRIFDKFYDDIVLAVDVKGLKDIRFIGSNEDEIVFEQIKSAIPTTKGYAVLKIWLNKKAKIDMPFFIFTDRLKLLDSITIYHQMEKSFESLHEQEAISCFELHCYALAKDMTHQNQIKKQLLEEFYHYFPECKDSEILHEHLQVRHDFPSFAPNLRSKRPEINTKIDGLFIAGDWVKLDFPAMLMEAAYSSGSIAANHIMKKYGIKENNLYSTSIKGALA
jgi:isorenieratene synthase